MSRIKEFYHDAINEPKTDDLMDDEFFFERWKSQQAQMTASRLEEEWELQQENELSFDTAIDERFDNIQKDIEASELPSFMHPSL